MTAHEAATAFADQANAALAAGAPELVADDDLRRVLTAAIRLYAAKSENSGTELAPFVPEDVTVTEAVTLACGVIRGAGLNLFDVAMWFGRVAGGL